MALDNPERVSRVALLDCLPISEHFDCADVHFATAWWYWFFFAQPNLPERVITAAPDAWFRGDAKTMGQENYSEWRAAMHDLFGVRGMLEEYPDSLTVDVRDERSDRAADRGLQQPLLALWSTGDDLEDLYGDPLVIWRDWATDVTGHGIDLGHHTAELAPEDLAAALVSFLAETERPRDFGQWGLLNWGFY